MLEFSDLHDLLVAPVEIPDLGLGICDCLAIDFHPHVPETVGHRVLGAHVHPELDHVTGPPS